MEIVASRRVQSIGSYAFAEVDREVEKLRQKGITPIDFGVGDPTIPTPEFIRKAAQAGVDRRQSSGYPSYVGALEFREAIAAWTHRRFGVKLDAESEIASSIGAKEAVFHFAEGFVNPGDLVIVPTPGYPPYSRGTLFAEGKVYYVPLLPENGFLIDLDAIPAEVRKKAKLIWINYPNSPSGAVASLDYLHRVVDFGQRNGILVASDEAYSEIYFGPEAPHSILEVAKEGVVVFQSLSKRSAMTCYRVGWLAGDARAISIFKKVKTNIDSGTATFIQDAAIAALADETHVEQSRAEYKFKRDILVGGLARAGLPDCTPQATIYLWQRVPKGMTSVELATRLLSPAVAIVTTPGAWLSDRTESGQNPGMGFVRFALVPSVEKTREAAEKLAALRL
ncbi:MAG: aminotransferase class I/II-fold pyridoxal phosphate-dependent enzyme [Planctomycetes bacterium]|nr:aminotransferase class I/II-fold pyridoxal phosphate-dependent enzyme [Planctomycetota bacterium]